ncbi:hypothetical protein wVul_1656 [Wolbachia endosymbiont of Armadillidium vulgare str. wVulC]|uniref:hypothetical protein n=1 Tax=Wolbachia endosymbiont of Armadillidium vulgare TaxID=77039 RepID=UPI00064AED18|nr:hypothetical protein [Wolbachia endosymbiont of Armadillidium vulgare]KLT21911.1 hypothetical protein wVul_1656 [Wolbachia endosymbiont of Armadillidium vulgare str. wVulC]
MKVIKTIVNNTNQGSKGNRKHLVYFFGLGESIKYNNESSDWGKWVSNKNIDIHLFDYHYMNFCYPEYFHDTKFRLKQVLITVATVSVIGFSGYFIIASPNVNLAQIASFYCVLNTGYNCSCYHGFLLYHCITH